MEIYTYRKEIIITFFLITEDMFVENYLFKGLRNINTSLSKLIFSNTEVRNVNMFRHFIFGYYLLNGN